MAQALAEAGSPTGECDSRVAAAAAATPVQAGIRAADTPAAAWMAVRKPAEPAVAQTAAQPAAADMRHAAAGLVPAAAAEPQAEQAEQAEFPIYSQDSNYDSSYDSSQNDTSYDSSQVDGSYDNSDTDSSDSGQITYPTEDSEDSSGSDTTDNTDIPDYTEDPSEDYGTEDSGDLDYTEDGSGTGSDNRDSSSDTSGQDIEY